MGNIKVKDLSDTNNITVNNELMVLTNDENNLVQNITVENLLTNIISTDSDNVLEQGNDGKLYVENPDILTGDLEDLTTSNKYNLVGAVNELNTEINNTNTTIGDLTDLDTADKDSVVDAINEVANLLAPSLNTINDSKGMQTGDIGSNATIYNDIVSYAHSTFDLSKFTVVGSPTITADGIASGFSASNYLTSSFTAITPSKIIFKTKGIYSSTPNAANGSQTIGKIQGTNSYPSIEYYSDANRLAAVRFHNNSNTDNRSAEINIPLNDGDIVEAEVIATSTFVTLNAKINGVPYTNTWSGNGLYCGAINGYLISNNSNWYWTGSIDLKQFSITVDGVEVINGNKTGIDTIKPDNYTVVGSPTITDDGVASGFSSSNYLSILMPNLSQANNWEIRAKFSINELQNYYNPIFGGSASNQVVAVTVDSNSKLAGAIGNSAGNAWQVSESSGWLGTKATIQLNKAYWVKLVFTGTQYKILISENGQDYTETVYYNSTQKVSYNSSYNFHIGHARAFTSDDYIRGSIDLNSFKIYVDGQLVYQPCLKIPYTESKTGSKVVDSVYRSRVNDMAEQFGYAPYYTLDEVNEDYTLPQSELYGIIGNCLDTKYPKQAEKDTIINWMMPDWSRLIAQNLTAVNGETGKVTSGPYNYTATKKGWVRAYGTTPQVFVGLYVNGNIVAGTQAGGANDNTGYAGLVPVDVGDTYYSTSAYGGVLDFIPCKGEI